MSFLAKALIYALSPIGLPLVLIGFTSVGEAGQWLIEAMASFIRRRWGKK